MLFRMAKLIYHFLMRARTLIQFLTFVLTLHFAPVLTAAPSTDVPPASLTPAAKPAPPATTLEPDSVQITPAPNDGSEVDPDRIRATRVTRDLTMNLSLGLVSGPLREKEPSEQTQIYGFGATFALPEEASHEYTLELTENGLAGIRGQYKKYCCLGENYEPYWTFGGEGLYNPSELLAGFVKAGSYHAFFGAGFEDLFRFQRRIRLEGVAGAGMRGTYIGIRLGYAFDESAFSF